ncbi:MAG: NUDIX hydrolase [Bacteroidales bacterium]|nr:NUDIX hydrolase [Bacteroidales bacterium]MCF8454675.1 NUDIX hydrolase [Bacteroidales bacterium]
MSYTYEYPRPALTVDAVVFRKKESGWEVLLIQRGNEPFKGMWAFPGGFVDMDEELDAAVRRELSEETGLGNIELHQLKTVGTIGRDPRGRTVSVIYWGVADAQNSQVKGGDDAEQARWFSVENAPGLAFDHHEILKFSVAKLANFI